METESLNLTASRLTLPQKPARRWFNVNGTQAVHSATFQGNGCGLGSLSHGAGYTPAPIFLFTDTE